MPTVPNRSDNLTPAGERKRKSRGVTVTKGEACPATIPEANPEWCKVAEGLWEAAQESGQSAFYETTDWWMLYLACDQVTYLYEQGRRSPEYLKGIITMLGSLMFTEADRRKVHVELIDPSDDAEEATIAVMNDYKNALGIAN